MRVRPRSGRPVRAHLLRVRVFIVLGVLVVATSVALVTAREWTGWLRTEAADQRPAAGRPVDPALEKARADVRHGRYDEAERALQALAAAHPTGEAALDLGLLESYLGRRDAAVRRLTAIANGSKAGDAASLARAGRAADALGDSYDANDFFRAAQALAPSDPAINTWWGDLFRTRFEPTEAMKSYRDALAADPKHAPAHLGIARILVDEDSKAAREAAQRALTDDPTLTDAHLVLAELALDDSKPADARASIEQALSINPRSLEARSLLAAMAYVEDRTADFDAEVARVLAIHPRYGEVYRVAGQLAARNYRFDEAVALVRRALALDESLTAGHADLGMHLLRTGDEPAARTALERAFKADGFNFVTKNLLDMLDRLEKFQTIEEGAITLRLHEDEAPVLREYAMPLAQEALKALSARYQFTPKGPILVEVFPVHDDFAVRNVGLPGMTGALGACFGRVVTMDSPRARQPGSFSWGATLWHEMAHVITLQMSNQRIPRWLTEGISVFEETRARPSWGRDMEVPFAQALEQKQVLKLRDLNAGFTRPDTIALAYYEASLLVEHIVGAYGEPALRTLVQSFRQNIDTEAALKAALGVDIDTLQVEFDKTLEKRFGAMRAAVRTPEALGGARDATAVKLVTAAHPGSYAAQLALGLALQAEGDLDGAIVAWEKAVTLLPMATGKDSARGLLARALIKKGEPARAMAVLADLLDRDHTDIDAARQLAKLADTAGDAARRWQAYERIVELDPFDASAHVALGRLALEKKNAEVAVREHRAALASNPLDVAAAHCDLGESYLLAGRKADARRHVMTALEIAPLYDRAQDLLLKIVEGRQ